MRIKITADSTCDLSPEQVRDNQITLFPLHVSMGGKDYRDGVDLTTAEIFEHVAKGGALCSTSAVSVGEYTERFEQLSREFDAVIHVSLGSGFSAAYQNACIASENLPNVYVVDSRNLSTGHGHVVMQACIWSHEMDDPEAVCARLRELTPRVETSFLLDRLDYMVKGGRCSTVTALGANLLKLKPCIEVIDGKMQVVKKYRGSYERCMENYVRERLEGRSDIIYDRIFITRTTATPEIDRIVRDGVEKYGQFKEIVPTYAGCTVACHCGPATLGILYIRKPDGNRTEA